MNNKIEYTSCIVCGNSDLKHELTVQDWLVSHEDFQIKECGNCSFRFTSNPPSADHAGPYYETEEYVEHSDNKEGLINKVYHKARIWNLKYKLNLIKKHNKGKKVLDVGSGSGYFLGFMKNNGYSVNGVEISDKAVALCKGKWGVEAHSPSQFMNGEMSEDHDVATMWHVFEHVYQYDQYFEMLHKSLAKDGILVMALPNYLCLEESFYKEYWNGYDTPRHIWHFTPETFKIFAEKRGFKLEKMHRLPLDSFYNCMISASYKKTFTFLPFTALIGFLSLVNSWFSFKKTSSPVYVFRKA